MVEYTIEEHKHRLAAWAASRAASSSPVCRFTVKQGFAFLKAAGFDRDFATPEKLPKPKEFVKQHFEWRENIRKEGRKYKKEIFHGIAAKLINCYLKTRFVCGGHHMHPHVKCLHPPIDRLLLNGLATADEPFAKEWAPYRYAAWSKFDSEEYEKVIALVRKTMKDKPLWMIEEYWKGHQ